MVFLNGARVSADGLIGSWTDLLEFTSVQPDGSNLFKVSGTEGSFDLLVNPQRRISKVDILFSYGNGALPSYIGVSYAGSLTKLTVVDLGNNLARAYGNITYAFYPALSFTVRKSGTTDAYYDLLSCKVASISAIDGKASGTLRRSFSDPNPLTLPNNFTVAADPETSGYEYKLIPVIITDWRKYDYVTLYGSISTMALNSFRASIGNKGLPYEITYMESIPTGTDSYGTVDWRYHSYTETNYYTAPENPDEGSSEDGYGGGDTANTSTVVYGGAVLYTITIDLTGIDRSVSGTLDCYFTCIASPSLGYGFNVQDASGSVVTADTEKVSWWNRFTTFMEDLFASDSDETNNMMESAADQSQDLAEDRLGAVAQAGDVIDDLTGAFQNHGVMDTIAFPSLTINFGGVPWTFGGWDVSVIPPGFEPLIETLKLLIDIIATLAFIQAMRHRLEKLLVGGNA